MFQEKCISAQNFLKNLDKKGRHQNLVEKQKKGHPNLGISNLRLNSRDDHFCFSTKLLINLHIHYTQDVILSLYISNLSLHVKTGPEMKHRYQ